MEQNNTQNDFTIVRMDKQKRIALVAHDSRSKILSIGLQLIKKS